MLYYTALFLIIVLVSAIAVWMYRGIFGAGRSTRQTNLHGGRKLSKRAKARLKARRKQWAESGHSSSNSNGSTPWGWKGTSIPHQEHVGHFSTEPSGPASTRKSIGWPYKEDKVDVAGKAYKVDRKGANGGKTGRDGKPWAL